MTTPVSHPPDWRSSFRGQKICKTPINWVDSALKHAFGNEYVMLKHCKHPDDLYSNGESHSDLDIVVMDCVLSRNGRIDMKNNGCREPIAGGSDAPVHPCAFDDLDSINFAIATRDGNAFNCCPSALEDSDDFYRACEIGRAHV